MTSGLAGSDDPGPKPFLAAWCLVPRLACSMLPVVPAETHRQLQWSTLSGTRTTSCGLRDRRALFGPCSFFARRLSERGGSRDKRAQYFRAVLFRKRSQHVDRRGAGRKARMSGALAVGQLKSGSVAPTVASSRPGSRWYPRLRAARGASRLRAAQAMLRLRLRSLGGPQAAKRSAAQPGLPDLGVPAPAGAAEDAGRTVPCFAGASLPNTAAGQLRTLTGFP
jgi:hypothetical protein